MSADADLARVLPRLGIDARLRGREWSALCPNRDHDDKHPSWRIREQPGTERHGKHNCFACGFGGSLEDLIMHVLGVGYREAGEWLRGEGVLLDRPVAAAVELKVRSVDRDFRLPPGVDLAPLGAWPPTARRYAEDRGLTAEQVERWGIGYSVEGRLAGRIIFPKRDSLGRLAGYTARTFVGDRRRYLEPEPWEHSRAHVMFGEQHWPAATNRSSRRLCVVEGAINALAVERAAGYACSVAATSGSQLHPIHAAKVSAFAEVFDFSDPDGAGDKLASALESALERSFAAAGKIYRRVRLPEGHDAASLPSTILAGFLT